MLSQSRITVEINLGKYHLQITATRSALNKMGSGPYVIDYRSLKPWYHQVGSFRVYLEKQISTFSITLKKVLSIIMN